MFILFLIFLRNPSQWALWSRRSPVRTREHQYRPIESHNIKQSPHHPLHHSHSREPQLRPDTLPTRRQQRAESQQEHQTRHVINHKICDTTISSKCSWNKRPRISVSSSNKKSFNSCKRSRPTIKRSFNFKSKNVNNRHWRARGCREAAVVAIKISRLIWTRLARAPCHRHRTRPFGSRSKSSFQKETRQM